MSYWSKYPTERLGEFVHTHLHSKFSPRDAFNSHEEILAYVKEIGQKAVALTDHYYMYNICDFYFKSKETGVKAIIGCELGVTPEGRSYDILGEEEDYFHITALAMNEVGKKNLMKLATQSTVRNNDKNVDKSEKNFYRFPRVKWQDFQKYNEGIIIISGCLNGEINNLITRSRYDAAVEVALRYKELFGDNYYIEFQDHGIDQQIKNNWEMLKLCEEVDVKPILTNDAHYTYQDYAEAHGRMSYGAKGQKYDGLGNVPYYTTDDFYIKNSDEMWEIAMKYDCPQMYNSTVEVGEKCEVVGFDTTEIKFPQAQLEKFETADEELRDLAFQLLTKKYPEPDEHVPIFIVDDNGDLVDSGKRSQETPNERLDRELTDIAEAGYSDYFLIVYDILKYCHDNDILVGSGRGSAGGSIVANTLDITDICPLKYGLFFERFFNKGRVDSPPDIDIDFPPSRRDEVIAYIVNKYGSDRVCQITTFGEIGGKSALNIACSSLYGDKKLATQIGYKVAKKGTLEWQIENVGDMKKEYKDKKKAEVIDWGIEITGCINNASTHAAGVVIGKEPLTEYIPLYANDNASGWTSQFEYKLLEKMRLLKMDILGLETLDMYQNTIWHIEETRGVTIDLKKIPEHDKKTFELFRIGDTKGIFQLEADWCNDLVKRANVRHFDHISALVALIRPGSMNSGMTETYMKCALGEQRPKAIHPNISYATEETYHCLLYQEQLMETAKALAGYDLLEADKLRKAVSKSNKDELKKMRQQFVDGCASHIDLPSKEANEIFDAIEKFGDYGFNKAHSVGYAKNSYISAYFKTHYFPEFMSALLTSVVGDFDKTNRYIDNILEHGYKMLPPSINVATDEFVPDLENKAIRFPLSAIDGVGPSAVDAIIEERNLNGEYKSFEDFVYRLPGNKVKKDTIQALICVGAFDELDYTRKDLYEGYEDKIADIRGKGKKAKARGLGIGGKEVTPSVVHKTGEEFTNEELVADEIDFIGFAFSLTEEEEEKRLRKILKNSKVDRGGKKDKRSSRSERSSRRGSTTTKEEPKTETKSKVSAVEKLKRMKEKKAETKAEVSAEEVAKAGSVKSSIKDRLSSKTRTAKKAEPVDVVEDDNESIIVTINSSDRLSFIKIIKVTSKYKVPTGVPVAFEVVVSDDSSYILETNLLVKEHKRYSKILEKIVGSENVRFGSGEWD